VPVEPESTRPLPTRRAAADNAGLFVSRLTSVPPAGIDPDVRTAEASVPRTAASEEEYRRQVGRRVRLARVALGLSQDQVARSAGVRRGFVSAAERGAQSLDAWRLRRVAGAAGVSVCWLLGHPGHPVR
jgi:DNA-binding XRE family transcriptional regulator